MELERERPATTTTLPIDGARLFIRDVGTGPTLVVLHGGPDFDHEYLAPELDALGEWLHVVYYDQRGRGRSFTGERRGDVSIASEIDDLDRVRKWTGNDTIALLGHSWGGLLAMEYAIRHPDRVSHLILLNTAPASHEGFLALRRELAARRTPQQSARMAELRSDPAYLAGDLAADAEFYRIRFGSTVPPDRLDELVRRLRLAFTPEGVVAAREIEDDLYAQTWLREAYDLIPSLQVLRVPTVVVRGEHDFIPVDPVRRIASVIQGSRFEELANIGHFAFLEQPDGVRAIIANFVAGLAPSRRSVRA